MNMPTLHPQLETLKQEMDDATARAKRLADALDDGAFARRPAGGGWSPAECLAHLNLTTKAFLPLIDEALATAVAIRLNPAKRYRKDPVGWLLTKMLEPPARMKVKAPPPFVPTAWTSRADVLQEFETLQGELERRITAAGEVDFSRLKVRSPFSASMRYNLLATFSVMAAHERRHLWQAERAAQTT